MAERAGLERASRPHRDRVSQPGQHPPREPGRPLDQREPSAVAEGPRRAAHDKRLGLRNGIVAMSVDNLGAQVNEHLGDVDANRAHVETGAT